MLKLGGLKITPPAEIPIKVRGRIIATSGPLIVAELPYAAKGDFCLVALRGGAKLPCQVVSFEGGKVHLAPLDHFSGLIPGAVVETYGAPLSFPIGDYLLGQVIDPLGVPLGGTLAAPGGRRLPGQTSLYQKPPSPMRRALIDKTLGTGVRAIDSLCPLGYGQRVGLLAGAGLGKSTLLAMIARNAEAAVNVIALVGERGREVKEFVEETLGPEGLAKSIVVCATSDEPPIRRCLAAHTATAIAEFFRAQGKEVLLLVDSLTRVARAIRDVGLASGELPVRQGYTASVYTELPALLERTGTTEIGSITAIYTILTNGDEEADPLAEELKSLLDGHWVLSQAMRRQGILPSFDPLLSVSRLAQRLCTKDEQETIRILTLMLSRLRREKDLLLFGGSPDHELKAALSLEPRMNVLLGQDLHEKVSVAEARAMYMAVARDFMLLSRQPPAGDDAQESLPEEGI